MQNWKFWTSIRLLTWIRYFSIVLILIFTWMTYYTWKQLPQNKYFAQEIEKTMDKMK